MPFLDFLVDLFITIGAKLGVMIGTTYILIIMLSFHLTFFILISFSNKFYLLLISIGIFGIGSGLSNITFMRNCWKYFPEHQGLVNGIIISASGIGSTIFTLLADFIIINPQRKETNDDGIYPPEVSKNVAIYELFIAIIMGILDLIGFFLTFEYDDELGIEEIQANKQNEKKRDSLENYDINSSTDSHNLNSDKDKNSSKAQLKLSTAFCSITNLKFFSFCFCGFCKK